MTTLPSHLTDAEQAYPDPVDEEDPDPYAEAYATIRRHESEREQMFLAELKQLCEKYQVDVSAVVKITARRV